MKQNLTLISTRLEQLTDIEEHFAISVQICRQQYGFYEPICSNLEINQAKKITKKPLLTKSKSKKLQGIKYKKFLNEVFITDFSLGEQCQQRKMKKMTRVKAKMKKIPIRRNLELQSYQNQKPNPVIETFHLISNSFLLSV